jgi:hypothetical protein
MFSISRLPRGFLSREKRLFCGSEEDEAADPTETGHLLSPFDNRQSSIAGHFEYSAFHGTYDPTATGS